MELQRAISERRLARWIGRELPVLVDETGEEGAIGRSPADAPEIDGVVHLRGGRDLVPGEMVTARITDADEFDLWGEHD